MNDNKKPNDELLTYQTTRLKALVNEIQQCCEDRRLFESREFGLPYAELKCLMLFDGQRYLTAKDIAQKLDVAKSRVTKIISGLIGKRLIEQVDDPKDARMKLFSLSADGLVKSREIEAFQRQIQSSILLSLEPDERKRVLSSLELLRSAMESVKKKSGIKKATRP